MTAIPDHLESRRALIRFTEQGARSDCPFCKGRMIAYVSKGDRIVLLKGTHAGREATVSNERGWSDDEFLVQFDGLPRNVERRIGYKRDEFAFAPLEKPPGWLCQFSIDDLCAIENALLDIAVRAVAQPRPNWDAEVLLPLFQAVRSRRLPVSGRDLWPTLKIHGVGQGKMASFCQRFDFGIRILTLLHGRAPVKRKKVGAMLIGRYQTAGQDEYFGPSPPLTFKAAARRTD
jgi:hypothetical protein